jgi:hypothetical protein
MKLLLILATFTPVYLYSILSNVTISLESTLAITLISLLSASIVAGIATLSKGSN